MLFGMFAMPEQTSTITLYTDAYIIRGTVRTRQRRLSDLLNENDRTFLIIEDALVDEFGSRDLAHKTDYAQVNLDAVLFAVADVTVDPIPELRTPKIAERALISIPPFKVIGRIHLLPERDLRVALEELTGRFLPVTDAAYWSDTVGEARHDAPMLALNHSRAQLLAPYEEVDPWAGLERHPDAAEP